MFDSENPYCSPQTAASTVCQVATNPGMPLAVTLVGRAWLYRKLWLSGAIEAELIWNGRGMIETVRVNGRLADSKTPLWYAPHFAFPLEAITSHHQVEVDVRLSRGLPFVVRKFRLRLDDKVIYSEGNWPQDNQ